MIAIKSVSRLKAASIHLAISAAVAAVALAVMLALWYPPPLFGAMGGRTLIALIVGVDVAIGPLITLIIFDPRKKELLFDLSVVAALQVAALLYGVYAMHAGRPVFTVFAEGSLAVVSAADIDPDELAKARVDEFRRLSLTGPRLVAADLPADPQERSQLAFAGLAGFGVQHLPKYYVPYADRRMQVQAAARALTQLPPNAGIQSYLARTGRPAGDLGFLRVRTRYANLLGIVDLRSGELLDILDIASL